MAAAIDGGELDFVGLGRPFCVFPNVANDILNGTMTDCTVPSLTTGVPKIDLSGMLETPWHMFQLHRMGKGLEPDPDMDVWMVYEKVTGRKKPVAS